MQLLPAPSGSRAPATLESWQLLGQQRLQPRQTRQRGQGSDVEPAYHQGAQARPIGHGRKARHARGGEDRVGQVEARQGAQAREARLACNGQHRQVRQRIDIVRIRVVEAAARNNQYLQ